MEEGGWSGHADWETRLPLAEARCLTSQTCGPLARQWPRAGTARHLGGGLVRLDWLAFASLQVTSPGTDGHVRYDGDAPVLDIGGSSYPLTPAGDRQPHPAG